MKEAFERKMETILRKDNRLNFQNHPGFTGLSLILFEIFAIKVFEISENVIFGTFESMQNGGTQN